MSPDEIARTYFPSFMKDERRNELVAAILAYGDARYREGREDAVTEAITRGLYQR